MKKPSTESPLFAQVFFLRIAVLLVLCAVGLLCQQECYAALPHTSTRYTKTKAALDALEKNTVQAKYRSAWEKLYTEFMTIYTEDTSWPNRPMALYAAAQTLEGLSRHSLSSADAQRAAVTYEKLAKMHRKNPLADDALYRAAKLYAAWMRDDEKALSLLQTIKKQYPGGDMLTEAEALERTIVAARNGKISPSVAAKGRKIQKPDTTSLAGGEDATLGKKIEDLKKQQEALLADRKRSCWRQPWERLESDLLSLHKKSKNRKQGAEALFSAAQARHAIAKCSHSKTDFQSAQELYLSLPLYFSGSPRAQEAQFLSAQILHQELGNSREARRQLTELLERSPRGSHADAAKTLLAHITKNSPKTEPVTLQFLKWDSIDKNRVQITLELSGKTAYQAKLVAEDKKNRKHLFLDLNNTQIAKTIKKGVTIKGSLLEGIFVEKNTPSVIRFDLRDAKRFDVSTKPDTTELLVTIDARKNVQPKTEQRGSTFAQTEKARKSLVANQNASVRKDTLTEEPMEASTDGLSIAKQLGLSVHTVFIDAGHGGKDPGTYHNNIVEKFVSMDVARTLGRLLENTGLKVLYSRTTDKFIPLTHRTAMANAAGADLFISIHVNANEKPTASGFETYYLSLARTPQAARLAALENIGSDRRVRDMQRLIAKILCARVDESQILALDIQRVTISRLKRSGVPARNNGIKAAPFHVLVGAQMPAVLVEVGYCSNPEEAKKLASAQYREWLAQGLAEGILAYKDRLAKNRTVLNTRPQTRKKTNAI